MKKTDLPYIPNVKYEKEILDIRTERELQDYFQEWLRKNNFQYRDISQNKTSMTDLFITDKNNNTIVCEIKIGNTSYGTSILNSSLYSAIGQIITAKEQHNANEMWIVFFGNYNETSKKIINSGKKYGIKFFHFGVKKEVIEMYFDTL